MWRLDVRARTTLVGTAYYQSNKKDFEEQILLKNLSLTGACVDNLSHYPDSIFRIKAEIPKCGVLELHCDVARKNGKDGVAVRLYYPDRKNIVVLWNHICCNLPNQNNCPYCNFCNSVMAYRCEKCGGKLNFKEQAYLEDHLKETMYDRVMIRRDQRRFENIFRVIESMDANFLYKQDQAAEKRFIGNCPAMVQVYSLIDKISRSDIPVLILGESGTGKELTAKAIHESSDRCQKPFITVNCAAIPENLLEAELFGFERGAFTGAYTAKPGKFELADGGTIFLDEIGDLDISLQAKLLRFIEDLVVERIGAKKAKKINVRILSATNCDLLEKVKQQEFRMDLYFRLNSFTINLPPLREREKDVLLLAEHFLQSFSGQNKQHIKGFSKEAVRAIGLYDWPGNVRELINKVRRGVVLAGNEWIEAQDLDLALQSLSDRPPAGQPSKKQEKESVLRALKNNHHVIARTAKALGVSRPTLYSRIKRLGIDHHQEKINACY